MSQRANMSATRCTARQEQQWEEKLENTEMSLMARKAGADLASKQPTADIKSIGLTTAETAE